MKQTPWADKQALRRAFDRLCADLSIQGAPIGAQLLQERMRAAGLMENELSRGIIEAREREDVCFHETMTRDGCARKQGVKNE
jgi:hypothetical protein